MKKSQKRQITADSTDEPKSKKMKKNNQKAKPENSGKGMLPQPKVINKAGNKNMQAKVLNKKKRDEEMPATNTEENDTSLVSDDMLPQKNAGNKDKQTKVLNKKKKKKLLNNIKQNEEMPAKNTEENDTAMVSDEGEEKQQDGGKSTLPQKKAGIKKMQAKAQNKKKKKKLLNNVKQNEEPTSTNTSIVSDDNEKSAEVTTTEVNVNSTISEENKKSEETTKSDSSEAENVEKENLTQTQTNKKMKKKNKMQQKKNKNNLNSKMNSNTEQKKENPKISTENGTENMEDGTENTDSDTEEVKPSESDEAIYKLLGERPEKIATLNEFQKRLIKLSLIMPDENDVMTPSQKNALFRMKRKQNKVFKEALNRGFKKGALLNNIDKSCRSTVFTD